MDSPLEAYRTTELLSLDTSACLCPVGEKSLCLGRTGELEVQELRLPARFDGPLAAIVRLDDLGTDLPNLILLIGKEDDDDEPP